MRVDRRILDDGTYGGLVVLQESLIHEHSEDDGVAIGEKGLDLLARDAIEFEDAVVLRLEVRVNAWLIAE